MTIRYPRIYPKSRISRNAVYGHSFIGILELETITYKSSYHSNLGNKTFLKRYDVSVLNSNYVFFYLFGILCAYLYKKAVPFLVRAVEIKTILYHA